MAVGKKGRTRKVGNMKQSVCGKNKKEKNAAGSDSVMFHFSVFGFDRVGCEPRTKGCSMFMFPVRTLV